MSLVFQNQDNGYTETTSIPFLWTLLFGCIYFAIKGVWRHVFIYIILAVCTLGVSGLIYPFFAKGILRNHYARMGWQEIAS